MSYVAITANGLRDGEAVFWAKGQWVKTFGEAELFATREPADAALSAARAQSDIVVESYMIDVLLDDGLSVSSAGDGDRVSHGRLLHSVPHAGTDDGGMAAARAGACPWAAQHGSAAAKPSPFKRFQMELVRRFEQLRNGYRDLLTDITARCGRFILIFLGLTLASLLLIPFLGSNFFREVRSNTLAPRFW